MTALDPKKLRKAIAKYREEIAEARSHGVKNEGQLSHAFATLLRTLAPVVGWDFLEQTAPGTEAAARIRPLRPRTNDWDIRGE
jgi:hypothetical protein